MPPAGQGRWPSTPKYAQNWTSIGIPHLCNGELHAGFLQYHPDLRLPLSTAARRLGKDNSAILLSPSPIPHRLVGTWAARKQRALSPALGHGKIQNRTLVVKVNSWVFGRVVEEAPEGGPKECIEAGTLGPGDPGGTLVLGTA